MTKQSLLLVLCLTAAGCLRTQHEEISPYQTSIETVDRMVFFDTAQAWAASEEATRVAVVGDSLVLNDERDRAFPRRGTWTSPVVDADFPFTELIPSWNVTVPAHTGAQFAVRTRDARSGEWSPWLHIGFWGEVIRRPDQTVDFEGGRVRIDVLRLEEAADAFQIQARIEDFNIETDEQPSIRRIAAVYSGHINDPARRAALAMHPAVEGDWARDLPVPFRTQQDNPIDVSGSTCSPTSVSMVLQHWGVDKPTLENALAIYDPEYGLFGNWNRAVAYASQNGLEGYITRIRDWDQVKAYIAQGQPVIASIRFRRGEFPSNVISSTNGHLIVIRGLTEDSDAIVNDPASRDRGDGVVYVADELAHAWFGHGGVAYIIRPSSD